MRTPGNSRGSLTSAESLETSENTPKQRLAVVITTAVLRARSGGRVLARTEVRGGRVSTGLGRRDQRPDLCEPQPRLHRAQIQLRVPTHRPGTCSASRSPPGLQEVGEVADRHFVGGVPFV